MLYLALESEGSECHFENLRTKELPGTDPKKDEIADEDQEFKSLYSGLDLSGWKADDEVSEHWQPRDTVLHYDGQGKELKTEKEHGNTEYVVDFRFPKRDAKPFSLGWGGDGGKDVNLFVTPDGELKIMEPNFVGGKGVKGLKPPGEWNRLRVAVKGQRIKVMLNGGLVHEANLLNKPPATGKLTLGAEGPMDFANLFVRELK